MSAVKWLMIAAAYLISKNINTIIQKNHNQIKTTFILINSIVWWQFNYASNIESLLINLSINRRLIEVFI